MFNYKTRPSARSYAAALLACVLAFTIAGTLSAQVDSTQVFDFSFDYSRFFYRDSITYLEVFASLPRNVLTYVEDEGRYVGKFQTTAEIIQGDSVLQQKIWNNVNYADSLGEISASQQLFCLNSFSLTPGEYKLRLRIDDAHSDRNAEYTTNLPIAGFSKSGLQLSDIQLASSIKPDTSKSIYVKNGLRVFPNSNRLYGIQAPIIYNYTEIYNFATPSEDQPGTYSIKYQILDSNGKVAKDFAAKIKKKPGSSAVEVNGVNVVALHSGTYQLVLEVEDHDSDEKASKSEKFFVYRAGDFKGEKFAARGQEDKGAGSPGIDAQRYDTMTKKEIDQEFDYTRYISQKSERSMYKKLNLDGKRQFIREFWAKRDPTPGTPVNEYKRNYLKAVETSNRMFKGTFKQGWRTDRGRVLLVYGAADEIERFPFCNENRAYEIWNYFSIQGGVIFIFVDKREMGEYELVHSSARGELYDPDWQRWISPMR